MKFMRLLSTLIFVSASFYADAVHDRSIELEIFKDCAIVIGAQADWMEYLNAKLAQIHGEKTHYQNSDTNQLFQAYPGLHSKLPYIKLAALPTPVAKLSSISQDLGCEIYIKRDDLSGGIDQDGNALYGGNKVRKLEFLLAQAKFLGAEKVMTFGCVGSNHAVATAVHACRLAMKPICMLKHQPPSHMVQQNLLHHLCSGTELHYSANNDARKLLAIMIWLEHYKQDGKTPYIIPTGGSNVLGTIGFVNAVFELVDQIKQGVVPAPTHIYVACGSCATTAGILLGCKAAGLDAQVVAIAVEPDEQDMFAKRIDQLFKETNNYLHTLDNSFPVCSYSYNDLRISLDFTGAGYGIFSPEGQDGAKYLWQQESLKLEGTYTAKAFAGMLADLKLHPQARALFWNTYCGLDFNKQLNKHDFHELPNCLHDYFDDANLQPLEDR